MIKIDIEHTKKRMKDEYNCLSNNEAYHFNRGFIWGTGFRTTKEERRLLYDFNEKCINEKEPTQ